MANTTLLGLPSYSYRSAPRRPHALKLSATRDANKLATQGVLFLIDGMASLVVPPPGALFVPKPPLKPGVPGPVARRRRYSARVSNRSEVQQTRSAAVDAPRFRSSIPSTLVPEFGSDGPAWKTRKWRSAGTELILRVGTLSGVEAHAHAHAPGRRSVLKSPCRKGCVLHKPAVRHQ